MEDIEAVVELIWQALQRAGGASSPSPTLPTRGREQEFPTLPTKGREQEFPTLPTE